MGILEGLKADRVFHYFEEISKIPRCSYEEQEISDYLVKIADSLGLESIQDEALNVIIKKPASSGYENAPVIVLQGHMDMVCEKKDSSKHDFSKDPIQFKVDGDSLISEDTTLGADNGVAVAMGLALLEDKTLSHPALEILITSNEETGMTGAAALNPDHIKGKILINLDSEEEGTALVSCAGGERNLITIPIEHKDLKNERPVYSLKINGLRGGHSGIEINQERGNSNKILARVLKNLDEEIGIDLIFIEGGSKSNAIPRSSFAHIVFEDNNLKDIENLVKNIEASLKIELKSKDKDVAITLEKTEIKVKKIFKDKVKSSILNILFLIPNGVQSMSMDIEGLVESSNNLGVLKTLDDKITIECAIRSSLGSLKKNISNKIKTIAELNNSKFESSSSYPAWEYKSDSYIREILKKTYKELYNEDLKVDAIHAGLECGLFDEKFDDMDMISFGPNIYGVHAPGESFSISSTERTYEFLLKILENIK